MVRKPLRYALWRAGDGWRWRVRAANAERVAAATEAYMTRVHAHENARLVLGERLPGMDDLQDLGGGRYFAEVPDWRE